MADLETEGCAFVYRLTTPKGDVHTLASDRWREILGTLYLSVACACDATGQDHLARGLIFSDLPGGLEPARSLSVGFAGYKVEIEVRP